MVVAIAVVVIVVAGTTRVAMHRRNRTASATNNTAAAMTCHSEKLFEIVALAVQLDSELGGETPLPPDTRADLAVIRVLRDMRIAAINNSDFIVGQMLDHLHGYMRNKGVCEIERTVEKLTEYLRETREQISAAKVRRRGRTMDD